jgi:hypothetical protein
MPTATKKTEVFISKELFDKISSKGRVVIIGGGGGSIGVPVDLAVLKTIDAKTLQEHGLQIMLVPIGR